MHTKTKPVWLNLNVKTPNKGETVSLETHYGQRIHHLIPCFDEQGNVILFESKIDTSLQVILAEEVSRWRATPPPAQISKGQG